ncbi:MAG: TrkA family potassium uptake protein [Tetrasphaera jenkinsii]|uniref:Trk system potassium uptake protein trkA n=1 Tax=Nostocoides jenkinsii Ben 74 TaxID=1193518 RepID=A0A077MBA9_9MICO|nr:TrkA family potassium uptake protein [Tetrasphaera jenkinsii]MCI1261394.1 TrkA family potassium uptake protein [Tetrasphaera jenkinsii]CCI51913.1 Trk system potassium uptake protein trkA [Tetrasphaera jenkinsii Ben 74]
MHFVIMGCGRVGASIARALQRRGHDVAIIDQEESSFTRLGPTFDGRTVTGMGFDRDTLREAGIDTAYAFAAVSSGDNSNILAARVARETFGVEHVVARIYDPGRAEIYQRLGIPTVATVKWTSDQVLRRLLPQGHLPELTDPSGRIVIAEVPVSPQWIGRPLTEIEAATGTRVAYVTRLGDGMLPSRESLLQEGDFLHLAARRDELTEIERVLDGPPPAHD